MGLLLQAGVTPDYIFSLLWGCSILERCLVSLAVGCTFGCILWEIQDAFCSRGIHVLDSLSGWESKSCGVGTGARVGCSHEQRLCGWQCMVLMIDGCSLADGGGLCSTYSGWVDCLRKGVCLYIANEAGMKSFDRRHKFQTRLPFLLLPLSCEDPTAMDQHHTQGTTQQRKANSTPSKNTLPPSCPATPE